MTKRKPITWTTVRAKLADLIPWEQNPRAMTESDAEAVRQSLDEFGVVDPLVANHDRRSLIGGHMRRLLLMEPGRLGPEGEADVRIPDRKLSDADARKLAVMLNRAHGRWDWDKLANDFTIDELFAAGFKPDDFDGATEDPPEGEDAAAKPGQKGEMPRAAELGDLWTIGRHRVLCGDSFDRPGVERLTEKKPVAVVLMDPPYAIYGSSTGVSSDVADDKMVRPFFEAMFRASLAALPDFGHCYVHCDWRSWASLWDGAKRASTSNHAMTAKNCLVWDKGGSGLGSNYANTYELIGFFVKQPRSGIMRGAKTPTGHRPILSPNVLKYNRPFGDDRPVNAAKPVELLAELIRNSCDEGGRVLDLFVGSGSTILAAEKAGRVGFGLEMEPTMVDVLLDRWLKAHPDEPPELLEQGAGVKVEKAAGAYAAVLELREKTRARAGRKAAKAK